MKKLILFLFLFPILAYGQDLGYDITKVNDTTFIVKRKAIQDEDADTLKTADEAWNISYNAAHQAAHRSGLGFARHQAEQNEFFKARTAHDALFPDSTYWPSNRSLIGPRFVGLYALKIGAAAPYDVQILILPAGFVQIKDLPPGVEQGTLQISSYNHIKIQNYFTGEAPFLYRKQGLDVWVGKKADGTRIALRRKN